MRHIVVIGSANLDTAVRLQAHPQPGETVLGAPIAVGAGGKGLNQAIAAARAGGRTRFVGAVGNDPGAHLVRQTLLDAEATPLLASSASSTGSAFVMVSESGENAIVVVPGANGDSEALTRQIETATHDLGESDIVLVQLEVPIPVVTAAVTAARARGATTVVNAAPSHPLPAELLEATTILVVNEHECLDLAGPDTTDVVSGAQELARQVETVVVTLGEAGALAVTAGQVTRFGAHRVNVVDTTAAGDTFCGAMASELAADVDLEGAVRFAMGAAALTVQRAGAADSIPSLAETVAFLAEQEAAATSVSAGVQA